MGTHRTQAVFKYVVKGQDTTLINYILDPYAKASS